jgi:hypothetical protein
MRFVVLLIAMFMATPAAPQAYPPYKGPFRGERTMSPEEWYARTKDPRFTPPTDFDRWLADVPESENIEDRRQCLTPDCRSEIITIFDPEAEFRAKRGYTVRKSIGEWPPAKE